MAALLISNGRRGQTPFSASSTICLHDASLETSVGAENRVGAGVGQFGQHRAALVRVNRREHDPGIPRSRNRAARVCAADALSGRLFTITFLPANPF